MRIAVLADSHIDHGVHGLDGADAWSAATDWIVDHQPDLVVVAGDMFHTGRPNGVALNRAAAAFERIAKADVATLVIAGNHEWIGAKAAATGRCLPIEAFSGLPKVKVVRSPAAVGVGDLKVAALPWPEPGQHADSVTAAAGTLAEKLAGHDGPRVCVAHAAVQGASVVTRRGTELDLWRFADEPVVPLADIDIPEAFTHTVLGHVHRRQSLSSTCGYVGSTEALGFADAGQVKGFSVLDWDDSRQRWNETLVPVGVHEFATIDIGGDGEWADALDRLREGSHVRLRAAAEAGADDIAEARAAVRDRDGRVLQVQYEDIADNDGLDDDMDSRPEAHPEMSLEELLDRWYETAAVPEPDRPHVTRLAMELSHAV